MENLSFKERPWYTEDDSLTKETVTGHYTFSALLWNTNTLCAPSVVELYLNYHSAANCPWGNPEHLVRLTQMHLTYPESCFPLFCQFLFFPCCKFTTLYFRYDLVSEKNLLKVPHNRQEKEIQKGKKRNANEVHFH